MSATSSAPERLSWAVHGADDLVDGPILVEWLVESQLFGQEVDGLPEQWGSGKWPHTLLISGASWGIMGTPRLYRYVVAQGYVVRLSGLSPEA